MLNPMKAVRLPDNPIISPSTPGWEEERVGRNINGPSLIRVPDWLPGALGRYYLYFAHHQGRSIRLAYADAVAGPWRIYTPGTLQLDQTPFTHHIASPDLHVDEANHRLVMYYHGHPKIDASLPWQQSAVRATSIDGLRWETERAELGESYFRVFQYGGGFYAVGKGGRLYRSRDGVTGFEKRDARIDEHTSNPDAPGGGHGRHWAVLPEGDVLHCWFSRWGDAPERILYAPMRLDRPWTKWQIEQPVLLLKPEYDWEGADEPIEPSKNGSVHRPVHELRDPAFFQDVDGRRYLLYCVAGEAGLAIAELEGESFSVHHGR